MRLSKNMFVKMLIIILLILLYFVTFSPSFSFNQENAFYILRINSIKPTTAMQNAWNSLITHYQSINVLIAQAYQINQNGEVIGSVSPSILNFANTHKMKLMVLVTNVGFDPEKIHQFLSNPNAQKKAIQAIVTACDQYHYYGVQFDFEGASIVDKSALTKFYLAAAQALHQKKFIVSIAVIPVTANDPQATAFLERQYENWAGVYDLPTIGKCADFVSIMAYGQHSQGTTPGPTADIRWTKAIIKYALQYIPSKKISLGIPAYSTYWATTGSTEHHVTVISVHENDIGYDTVNKLLNRHHIKLQWSKAGKIDYAIYQNNWLYEYLFVENEKSFKAKLKLVKKYHLRGISVFDLGSEDPQIWQII